MTGPLNGYTQLARIVVQGIVALVVIGGSVYGLISGTLGVETAAPLIVLTLGLVFEVALTWPSGRPPPGP